MFLVESRERLDDIRKWRSRWWGHDGSGVPASFPGFRHQCNKVRRKEGSGQGWLVKTQVFLFRTDKLTQVRTLRHPETSTLSFAQRSLSVFVPTVSLWQLVRPSLHSVSLFELPFHGSFYLVSTPITAIRHRWSSFCTWPTYLPLSPESFSRCRLRWTTPPSPHTSWMCSRQICSNCVMLSRQYESKYLRNVSNTLLNLRHEELRQFWRQKGVQPGTSKVYLIKWPVSVYVCTVVYKCNHIY